MELKEKFDINEIQDEDKELVKAWIGTKYQDFYLQKYYKGDVGFNFSAFLIPELLFITRKMWIECLAIVLFDLLFLFLNGGIPAPVVLVVRLILGFVYYPLYSANIKRKIEKYKKQGLSYEQQLEVAKKYGGDKITIAVLLFFIIEIALFVIWGIRMANLDYSSKDNKVNRNENIHTSVNSNENEYLFSEKEDITSNLEKTEDNILDKLETSVENDYNNIKRNIEQLTTNNEILEDNYTGNWEFDKARVKYDTRKWKQIEIPDVYKDRYQGMIQNIDVRYVIGLRMIQERKENIFSESSITSMIEGMKAGKEMALTEELGFKPDVKVEVKKINDKVLYFRSYYKDNESINIRYQIDNNNCVDYSFNILNNENLLEKDILEINSVLGSIEFNNN